jgi:aldehyde dehydrogenase (NAD+)
MQRLSAGNLKRLWSHEGRAFDWFDVSQNHSREILAQAVQVKNVWIPYGE